MMSKFYPEGAELKEQIAGRHRRGFVWQNFFLVALIIGILALVALIYNITNQAFGLVAVQTENDPDALVLAVEEGRMLNASNVAANEDDNVLAEQIASDPNGIGFFGYAYYLENADKLKLVNINGVEPNAETAESGEYPLSRPLFIYTTAELMAEKPQVAEFVNFYLNNVNDEIEAVGYFPASAESNQQAITSWLEANGEEGNGLPAVEATAVSGNIAIAGSSTVYPLTLQMAQQFNQAGFAGTIDVESIGSTGGLRRFCVDTDVDMANASRAITVGEFEACRANGLNPLELRVGTDALVVVVHPDNTFLNNATLQELRTLFTTAQTWSDANPAWPNEPIDRYIPGADSGTLDFFTGTIFPEELADLDKTTLTQILANEISSGVGRRLEREQRFFDEYLVFETQEVWDRVCSEADPPSGCSMPERDQESVYHLVVERVVQPDVVATWSIVDSVFRRSEILATAQLEYPSATLEWRSWLTGDFLSSPQSSTPELAGVRTAIFGSLWVVAITILFSFPIGVGAAIYLEEYAIDIAKGNPTLTRINSIIQTNINNLAGVPSIIYGMLGLAIFVRVLESFTSGTFFGAVEDPTTANGRTIISAGLTLGLLILPMIIINSQEAIKAVPSSLRQASFGLGATKWQTIWYHVLPNALPGIMTGTILAMSRAIGETAPLVVVGASTFITVDPSGPFAKFTTLPIQIYQWTSRPQGEFRNIAAAAIIVLLVLLLSLNATAVILRNRYSGRVTS